MSADTSYRESRLPRFSLDRRITVLVLLVTVLVMGAVATVGIPLELFPSGFNAPHLSVQVPGVTLRPRRCSTRSSCRSRKSSRPSAASTA